MGMKRAREVLSATGEAATSEAPPNDPALPRNPPQPVPPPGRLLPPPRPLLPVPALPPAPAPGRPPPAGWLPPPATSMPRLAAPAAPPVWLLPQGRGLASARATSCATATAGRGRSTAGGGGPEIIFRSRLFLHGPSDPSAPTVQCFTACAYRVRICLAPAEPALSTHDGTRRSARFVVVYCMYLLLLILTTALD